ncbi:MAG: outer membrane protein assembly factor BamC [Burkholderiaceae bacterium]
MKPTLSPAAAIAACALVLAGCSAPQALTDLSRIEYRTASQGQRLEIPPDLVSPKADDRFAVPQRAGGTSLNEFNRERTGQGSMSAVKGAVLPQVAGARLERDRDRRWLVIDQPPARVWSVVREFWTGAGFALVKDSPETGVLETDWNETRPPVPDSWLRAQLSKALGSVYTAGTRDKFLVRLEPAPSGGTEVYLSHRRLEEVVTGVQKESTFWTQQPADPQLEAEFLRRMMLRFVPESVANAAVATAGSVTAAAPAARVSRLEREGQPMVKLTDGFDRSWRQVGMVLDRSGFTVEDRDRTKGVYFVRYVDPQREARAKGLLDRITGTTSKDLSSSRYQITVKDDVPGTLVGVLTADGKVPASEVDRRIASQIVQVLAEALR